MRPRARRNLALLASIAWLACAFGTTLHGAFESSVPHGAADCPICHTSASFLAVQPDPPHALAVPARRGPDAHAGPAVASRPVPRSDPARAPPASLIT